MYRHFRTFLWGILIMSLIVGCTKQEDTSATAGGADDHQNDITQQRVVYEIPAMDQVKVESIAYKSVNDLALMMDVYYPPKFDYDGALPAVIFVFGYPDSTMTREIGSKLKDIGQYISWGRLTAASGLIAITYETQQPDVDIDDLISYVRQNAASLKIDKKRIGIWSCSANVPTAMSVIVQESSDYLKCAVLYYGLMLTTDQKYQVTIDSLAQVFGYYSPKFENIEQLPQGVPVFVVRAGLDTPDINRTIDHFVSEAIAQNVPTVFINYADGHHGFDIFDDNDKSRGIIKQTLEFMKSNLL